MPAPLLGNRTPNIAWVARYSARRLLAIGLFRPSAPHRSHRTLSALPYAEQDSGPCWVQAGDLVPGGQVRSGPPRQKARHLVVGYGLFIYPMVPMIPALILSYGKVTLVQEYIVQRSAGRAIAQPE